MFILDAQPAGSQKYYKDKHAKNSQIREDTCTPPNRPQVSQDTEDSGSLDTFVVCEERILSAKHSNTIPKSSGRE